MKKLSVILSTICLLASVHITGAYETPTHRALSEQAVEKSILRSDGTILEALGLKPLYDRVDPRNETFPNYQSVQKNIFGLVGDGSVFEDDNIRVQSHFYDPVNNRPLADGLRLFPHTSPDWALEDRGEVSGLFTQNNSFLDGRRFFLTALTEQSPTVRNQHFGLTFQTLGQVIHHLQDMAQPQHVRNDQHLAPSSLYEASSDAREVNDLIRSGFYTDSYPPVRFNSARQFWLTQPEGTVDTGRGTGQGIAEFTVNNFVSAGENFRVSPTASLEEPIKAHEILPAPDYPRPNNVGAQVRTFPVGDPEYGGIPIVVEPPLFDLLPNPLTGKVSFIETPITEVYAPWPSRSNERTSTFSVYSADLRRYNFLPACQDVNRTYPCRPYADFALNEFNFEAARAFLLPRAIAYSAGMIDYFSRGKMEMCDGESSDQSIIKNLSKTEDMKGVFALYYDDATGVRHRLARWTTAEGLLPPDEALLGALPEEANGVVAKNGGEMRVTFTAPDPKPDTYFLVFSGDMGEEKAPRDSEGYILPGGAVVVKKVDITKHCKGTLWVADSLTSSVLAYHLPDGQSLGSFSLPNVYGIAYDPADGNLWYTSGSGGIGKVTPEGTALPVVITVHGTQRYPDGTEQQDFSALDVDPLDPAYLWVAGWNSISVSSTQYLYRVRISDGQVERTCQVVPPGLPTGVSGVNLLLAAANLGGRTVLFTRPGPAYATLLVMDAQTCAGIDRGDFFSSWEYVGGNLVGIEANGNELLAAVQPSNGNFGVYTFGSRPYLFKTFADAHLLFSLPYADGDLALGSDF